jgi:hypothetical protein
MKTPEFVSGIFVYLDLTGFMWLGLIGIL